MQPQSADFVTLVRIDSRANKLVSSKGGETKKQPGPPISKGTATTVSVPNLEAMASLLQEIGEDESTVLCLGYFPGTEPKDSEDRGKNFTVMSRKKIAEAIGTDDISGWHEIRGQQVIARTKVNMRPSTWMGLDRDLTDGMPEHLQAIARDEETWLGAIADLMPGFSNAGFVKVASTTGRVCVNGTPMEAKGAHYFIQVQSGEDVERFGAVALHKSFLNDLGFMRPFRSKKDGSVVHKRQWSIFDPTVFSHERLWYDGKPSVRGKGLTVTPPTTEVREGEKLDTSALISPTEEEIAQVKAVTGLTFHIEIRRREANGARPAIRAPILIEERTLTPETLIETEEGEMSLINFWRGSHQRLRCQTPFRDSGSWNGIVGLHEDGAPFVFDNGTRVKFVLSPELLREHHAEVWEHRLRDMPAEEVRRNWTRWLRNMSPSDRERIRHTVGTITGLRLRVLDDELKEAQDRWRDEENNRRVERIRAEAETEGRIVHNFNAIRMARAVEVTEATIFNDTRREPVLGHGLALAAVEESHPTRVREVKQAADGAEYPKMPIIKRYGVEGLALRVAESVIFMRDFDVVPPPPVLMRTMREVSPGRAPGLTGIIEHPLMDTDGSIISGQGYDRATGLYKRVPMDLIPELPGEISQTDAVDALRWIVEEVCRDFPFATPTDLAGFVSMLLTAIQRRVLGGDEGCPGGAISAPVQSSGKTALTQVIFQLVYGRPAAATSWSQDDVEMGKHLLAVLMEGHAAVVFDNLPEGGKIESNELAKAMTSATYSGRVLGENRKAMVPTNVLWLFTGNNVSPVGDFNTRVLLIYLDPDCDDPDRRTFSRPDLADWSRQNRARFFECALTILVGYNRLCAAGARPEVTPTRYSEWDRMVREALIWAGAEDPADLFEKNKQQDPVVEGRLNLLMAWYAVYGDEPVTASALVEKISKNKYGRMTYHSGDDEVGELVDALRDLMPEGALTSKRLGSVLRRFQGQWLGGYQLQSPGPAAGSGGKGARVWKVIRRQKD